MMKGLEEALVLDKFNKLIVIVIFVAMMEFSL
jgi:hypothetical protein